MKRLLRKLTSFLAKGYYNILVNVKIRNKLLVSFISFAFIPLMVSIIINFFIINPLMIKNTVELERRALSQYCNDVTSRMNFYDIVSKTILGDKELLSQLNREYSGYLDSTYAYYDYFNLLSNKYTAFNNNFMKVIIYVDNPSLVYDNYYIFKQDEAFLESDIFNELFVEGSVKGIRFSNEGKIIFYRILNYYHSKNRYPVLFFEISSSEVLDPLSDLNASGDVFIFDSQMNYLTHSGREDAISKIDEYAHQMTRNSGVIGGSSFYDEVVIYQKTDFNLTIVKIVEPTRFFTDAKYVNDITSILITVCALTLATLIFIISRWLTSRIKGLVYKINHIKLGIYDEPLLIAGRDEIGEASRALDELSKELKYLIDTVYKSQLTNTKLLLDVMQARINPHFLYNTLSAIDWFIQKNDVLTSRELLNSLVLFYRCSLGSGNDIVSIADELTHLQMYLKIEIRLLGNIEVEIDIPDELHKVKMIRMTLQPIVENAIKHGRRSGDDILHIHVEGCVSDDIMIITVRDDGVGFPKDMARDFNTNHDIPAKEPGSGMGITNVDRRIRLHFGEQYGVYISELSVDGSEITIRVPFGE